MVTIWQIPLRVSLALILQTAIAVAKLQMHALLALVDIILRPKLHALFALISQTAIAVAKILTHV